MEAADNGGESEQRQRLDTTAKMRAWATRSEVGRKRQSFQNDQRRTGEVLRTRRTRREKRTYVPTFNRSHLRFTKPYKRKSDQDLPIADAALMELERFFQECDKKEKESKQSFIDTHPLPMPPLSSHREVFQRMTDFLARSEDEDLIKQSRLKLLQTFGLFKQENANVRDLRDDLKEVRKQKHCSRSRRACLDCKFSRQIFNFPRERAGLRSTHRAFAATQRNVAHASGKDDDN